MRGWPGVEAVRWLFAAGVLFALCLSSPTGWAQDAPAPDEPESGDIESEDTESEDAESEDRESEDAESADTESEDTESDDMTLGPVVVEASAEDLFETGGSVHRVGERELQELNYDDPGSVLQRVPGVYVRSEEGFGLRPNIGLRGAPAERSRKVTLMEDGVLLAPAPYSAPAAYYFPLITRMTGVDVYLGPAAVLYGPNTIGGAIDFRGREIPSRREGRIDLALGSFWYGRAHLYYGDSNEWGGFLVEAVHVRSDGFGEMDSCTRDCGTGFGRTDIQVRGDLHGMAFGEVFHQLELTLGLGLEESDQSYLGITDDDFRQRPYRRYAATQLDRMEWWRTRAQLRYLMEIGDDAEIVVTAYRHDFSRTFRRMEAFADGTTFGAALGNRSYLEILRGEVDTMLPDAAGTGTLVLASNGRVFVSQGIQASGRFRFETAPLSHDVTAGVRVHFDEITRNHVGQNYAMISQTLSPLGEAYPLTRNHDQAWALSAYASWAVTWERLTITPGARVELILAEHAQGDVRQSTNQYAFLPGIGATYEVTPGVALFGGVYQGFSPVAPGQAEGTLPELAVNYEVGARYGRASDASHASAAFFLSDYSNLSGVCSFASGCSEGALDRQFNGGAVTVLGVEAAAAHEIRVDEVGFPLRATYTYTYTRFRTGFESDNPQFGSVAVGDHLPYVPEHQLSFQAGFDWRFLGITATGAFVSEMRDTASHGAVDASALTEPYFLLDATARVEVLPGFRITARAENITDTRAIVTRRPFGARPPRPFMFQAGLEVDIP